MRRMPKPSVAALVLIFFAAAGSGCQVGPSALKVANAHYSDAVRIANSEQLLVNLVRMRYRDEPVFLNVSNISTQFELRASTDVSGTINESGPNVLGLGVGVNYAERPTISFSIMGGEEFQRRMLRPVDVASVSLLAQSGWRGDRVLRLTVNQLNALENAPTAAGPTPRRAPEYVAFLEAVSLLSQLSADGLIDFEFVTTEERVSDPIPIAQLEAADLLQAAEDGVEFKTLENGQTVGLFYKKRSLVLRIAADSEHSQDLTRLTELLSLDPANREVEVIDLEDSKYDPLVPRQGLRQLGIATRSLMGVMYYLSNGVEPPSEHLEMGIVTQTVDAQGHPFEWSELLSDLFAVRSSRRPPKSATVAVRHRGHWFYIDDRDETSKSTFLLLSQLFALQAGEVEQVKPVLTLPVG